MVCWEVGDVLRVFFDVGCSFGFEFGKPDFVSD